MMDGLTLLEKMGDDAVFYSDPIAMSAVSVNLPQLVVVTWTARPKDVDPCLACSL